MNIAANLEKRTLLAEIRAKGRRLQGYAAIFNNEAQISHRFTEVIRSGAFSASLASKSDILALVDHDVSKVLARTRSGTLRLSEDSKGLAFDLDVPETQAGCDVLELASRGDLGGMSFGFNVIDEIMNGDKRELLAIELIEISVVQAFPAYEGTVVNARSSNDECPYFQAYVARQIELMELSSWGY